MKSYQIVYFDSAGARGVQSFTVRKVIIPLAIIFTLAAVTFSITITLLVLSAEREIADLRSKDYIYTTEKKTMNESASKIEKGINFLQDGRHFAQEIFSASDASAVFNYADFMRGLNRADLPTAFSQIDDKNTYRSIPRLTRVAEALISEADYRKDSYVKLFEHLEERNIVFAHTPSILPGGVHSTSAFGFRRSPITGIPSYHEGVDFGVQIGTAIRSAADGIVVYAGTRSGYGNLVTVDHGFGYMTRYAHCSKLLAKQGDFVKKGDVIAFSGNTGRSIGPHLHYEVLFNGCPVNASKFLPKN